MRNGETIQIKDKSPFLRDYLDTFRHYILSHNSITPKTKEYYVAGIAFLASQPISDLRIHLIRTSDVETIQFPKTYSGSTINRVLRTLHRALNAAMDADLIARPPKGTNANRSSHQPWNRQFWKTSHHPANWRLPSCSTVGYVHQKLSRYGLNTLTLNG